MVEVIKETKVLKSKKKRRCDAWMIISECLSEVADDCNFAEKRALVKALRNNGLIDIGEPYIRQFNKMDGETYTWIAIPELHEICLNQDLYQF